MSINGVPLHPLVVHAAVVFVPLAALAAIVLVVPRWRSIARWPALVLSVGGLAAVQLAIMSGEDLEHERHLESPLVHQHEGYAETLRIVLAVLVVLVVVAFFTLGYTSRFKDGRDRASRAAVLDKGLVVLLPVAAIATLVYVVLTGDAGARAVWGG